MRNSLVEVRTVALWRDVDGYEIKDYGPRPTDRIVLGRFGEWIEGKSGIMILQHYSAGQGLWWRAAKIAGKQGVCNFMGYCGPLDRATAMAPEAWPKSAGRPRLGGTPGRPYPHMASDIRQAVPVSEALRLVDDVKVLASYVEQGDRKGFLATLGGSMTSGVSLNPSAGGALWTLELSSVYQLLKYDMWCEFGSEPQFHRSFRNCENCGKGMQVGGRKSSSQRSDARFCSVGCRVAAHQRMKRMRARTPG